MKEFRLPPPSSSGEKRGRADGGGEAKEAKTTALSFSVGEMDKLVPFFRVVIPDSISPISSVLRDSFLRSTTKIARC